MTDTVAVPIEIAARIAALADGDKDGHPLGRYVILPLGDAIAIRDLLPKPPRIAPADGVYVRVWEEEQKKFLRVSTGEFNKLGALFCYDGGAISGKGGSAWINYELLTPEHLTGGVK